MQAHLTGTLRNPEVRGGPGDEEFEPEVRKDWERELARERLDLCGLAEGIRWARSQLDQQVIFHEEYARAGGPGRMGHIGEGSSGRR